MFDKRRQRNSQEIKKVNKWNFPKACFSYNYGHGHRKLATKPPKPKIIRLNSEKFLIFYFSVKNLENHTYVELWDFSVHLKLPEIHPLYDFHDFFCD